MKSTSDTIDPTAVAAAEPGFVARQLMSELAERRAMTPAASLSFSRLYHYATAGDGADAELEAALRTNARMRDDLRHLIAKTARHHQPAVAAAGSLMTDVSQAGAAERQGSGWRLWIRPSRAERSQFYVIIEVDDSRRAVPSVLFLFNPGRGCRRFDLPRSQDGIVQVLVERHSDLLHQLRDTKTEVFLR